MDSVETSIQYLSTHDWDVERAIETVLISNSDLPRNIEPVRNEPPQIPPNTSVPARYIPNSARYVSINSYDFI